MKVAAPAPPKEEPPEVTVPAPLSWRAAALDRSLFAALLVAAIGVALGLASALVAVTGSSPGDVWDAMIDGSVGSTPAIVTTLNHSALILTVAIGACIAFRAGLINIGPEGQLTFGALLGTAVGLALPFDGGSAILLVLLTAAAGGALWALIPAILKYWRGVSEVVTTLLLNFIAFQAVSFAVNRTYLLQETVPPNSPFAAQPQSDRLPEADRIGALADGVGYRLQITIALSIALALVVAFLIARSPWGLRLRMFGFNPRIARRVGARPARIGGGALLLSGGFAGLAGGFLLTGVVLRLQGGFSSGIYGSFSNNFGWEGLLAALVARFRPVYAIAAAIFFGGLRAGGGVLASTGVNSAIVSVVQALLVLAVTLPAVLVQIRSRRRQAAVQRERT
jgi:general nucleoside transport system permease protein